MTPLILAAKAGHAELVTLLDQIGASLDIQDKHGRTALIYAAHNGHDVCTQRLHTAGANVDAKDMDGCTPLIMAVVHSHYGCADQRPKFSWKRTLYNQEKHKI